MRADLPAALGAAVFAAPTGRLSGPVHSSLGWSVFEVVAVMPAVAPALERARQTIASILGDRRANATRERWYRALRARYRPLTRCSEEIRLPSCSAPGAS
jgi:parvulin-like peptidyl-prolyl isomerase